MESIDSLKLVFDQKSLVTLNIVLALIMFGVALDLRLEDFRRVIRAPRGPLVGLLAQFIVLPAATFLLTLALELPASVVLGMILVAACPGGNLSNFITNLAGGRTVLSVSMTAVSTVCAVFMTPLNVAFWGGLHPQASKLLTDLELDVSGMFLTVVGILGIPLVIGMTVAAQAPRVAAKMRLPFKVLSIAFFVVFIGVASKANLHNFEAALAAIFIPVALMNAMAFATGYGMARAARLEAVDARAVSIEVGIQNSGLALVLIFQFFDGLGGMATVAAWWGIWHVIVGLGIATAWSRVWPLRDKGQRDAGSASTAAET